MNGLFDYEQVVLVDEYDEYQALPEAVRCSYSREQWLWLGDGQKQRLVEQETEPEAV